MLDRRHRRRIGRPWLPEDDATLRLLFQRLLAFRNVDGSFSYVRGETPSVWATAVALRALYTLHKEETGAKFADSLILKATLQWLLAHQSQSGSFNEVYLYDGYRNGQLPRLVQSTPLTAQVLVILADIAIEVPAFVLF